MRRKLRNREGADVAELVELGWGEIVEIRFLCRVHRRISSFLFHRFRH